jgi:pimeloyl-ACP methyl ester carboxylesterase
MKNIVWIHGLNCTSKIFTYLQSTLPRHKATLIDYDSHRAVEESVDHVATQLMGIKGRFTLVCHSLGGIIGKLIAQRHEASIDNIVTISTPFGGSDMANKLKWFFPSMHVFRDLSASSNILAEAKMALAVPHTAFVSTTGHFPVISSPNDGVVTIDSQRDVEAQRFIDVSANHFEVLQDGSTVTHLKKIIFGK